ncbi:MAG: alpha/beta fold hydrolase [Solirubrobacteraceae bacterium]
MTATTTTDLQYTDLPERAQRALETFVPDDDLVNRQTEKFADVQPREPDHDGDTEVLDGQTFTHHFVDVPGDQELVRWHYVEAGEGEPVVFLHGIPDSWFQWHHQMAALAGECRCIAVDLKGYGQSEKERGDYRHVGAAGQLFAMLDQIGLDTFNLITHDRGTVQGDYIVADHPDRVLRYGRGEQHLYHFNPAIAPQDQLFADAPWSGLMEDPKRFAVWVYAFVCNLPVADSDMRRVIQEFSYPGTTRAVPRYFLSSNFRKEWIERRTRLLDAWRCPVTLLQGADSRSQPREFYTDARDYIPNARSVHVRYIPGGHFWTLESPQDSTEAIREALSR